MLLESQFGPVLPSEAEALLAKKTSLILAQRLASQLPIDVHSSNLAREETIRIPDAAARLLVQILEEMSRGNAVKMIPVQPELTTQQAADMLNVSRPTLISMLNQGKVAFRKVGAHRRVRLDSLLNYQRRLHAERRAVLEELSAYDRELGL